jgi:4,5-dihydroxyphthalate decarboxylase
MKMPLTLACGIYDRTLALQTGMVVPEGIDLNYLPMGPGQLFRRQARNAEFDVAEFSLGTYVILRARGDRRMIAIPVFPSRKFRHGDIYINARSGIQKPEDLANRRIGAQEYQQTAAIWIRGMLQEEYGVRANQIEWYFGGYNKPENYSERIAVNLPSDIRTVTISNRQSLNQMLENGELEGLIGATTPLSFAQCSPTVTRLFGNPREIEIGYYRRTGIFPIMHVIVIKREVYERAPWVAVNLYQSFEKAKAVGLNRLGESGTLFCALPWLCEHVEDTRGVMGDDSFAYGIARNRRPLQKFLEYCHAQGLAQRLVSIEELFAPEILALENGG